jgi:hypothetical protein
MDTPPVEPKKKSGSVLGGCALHVVGLVGTTIGLVLCGSIIGAIIGLPMIAAAVFAMLYGTILFMRAFRD